jgi:polyvinyl alcohol dehydrogenase (cytochrome)
MRTILILVVLLVASIAAKAAEVASGEALYHERCAGCHDAGIPRAPDTSALQQMSAARIGMALTFGIMSAQGRDLSQAELSNVVRFLVGRAPPAAPAVMTNICSPANPLSQTWLDEPRWNGWGVDLAQHRFQPAAMAQLKADEVPRLKLKWAFGFPGDTRAYAQPAIVGGRLFVGSAGGKVYSLDAKSGCVHWIFDAGFSVRTAVSIGGGARGAAAYFGDQRGNVFAVDAEAGTLLWKIRVEEHPAAMITGAPTLAGTSLYVPISSAEEVLAADRRYPCCSFRGGIAALDAATGALLWKSYTITEEPKPLRVNGAGAVEMQGPSGAPVWSSPTVDLKARMLYVTTGQAYSEPAADMADSFVAFQMDTGKLAWSHQATKDDIYNIGCMLPDPVNCSAGPGPDLDFGSSAILVELRSGKRALMAGQKSGFVHAVDPDHDGAILWQNRIGRGGPLGGIQWGSATDGEKIYVALSDVVPEPVPEGTPGSQKSLYGGGTFRMNPRAGGGLFALDLDTGKIAWHAPHPGCGEALGCGPGQSAAVTVIPGIVFSGGLDGHLRAYSALDGEIVWDVDTKGDYQTVNGVPARGGSLDGPGPVVVGGMLYVNSGYTNFGTIPGNVLLAYSIDGQ